MKIFKAVALVGIGMILMLYFVRLRDSQTPVAISVAEEKMVQVVPEVSVPKVAQDVPVTNTNELQARISGLSFAGPRR